MEPLRVFGSVCVSQYQYSKAAPIVNPLQISNVESSRPIVGKAVCMLESPR